MSKIVTVELKVNSIEVMESTCRELGFQLKKSTTFTGWASQQHSCEYKVVVPDSRYEIGLVKDGSNWNLQCDHFLFYDKRIGTDCQKLTQIYGVNRAVMEAEKYGLFVTRETAKNGDIVLEVAGRFQ
jgi:hypothetical protein